MSSVKTTPVTWSLDRLMCDCGGEFRHMISIKYSDKPFVHACDKCGMMENTTEIYPKTTYKEV